MEFIKFEKLTGSLLIVRRDAVVSLEDDEVHGVPCTRVTWLCGSQPREELLKGPPGKYWAKLNDVMVLEQSPTLSVAS